MQFSQPHLLSYCNTILYEVTFLWVVMLWALVERRGSHLALATSDIQFELSRQRPEIQGNTNKYREFQDVELSVLTVILRAMICLGLLGQSGDNEYLHCLDVLV